MIASLDELVGVLQGWMEAKSLVHVRARRFDLELAFDGCVVSAERDGFRLSARRGGFVITISLQPDFNINFDDVPAVPEHRHNYFQGITLLYPSATNDTESIILAQVRDEQI